MRRYLSFMIFLLMPATCLYAQSNSISDLKKQLQYETNDTSRVMLLNQLSLLYLNTNPDTALSMAQEALLLSEKLHFLKGEANSLKRLATVFDITGNYPKALELSLTALKKFENIKDTQGIQAVLMNISIIFGEQEDYKQALKYCYRAKVLATKSADDPAWIQILINVGTLYELSNQLDSARFYVGEAYNAAMRVKNLDFIGISLAENGNINRKMGQLQISLEYYRAAIPYLNEVENYYSLCDVYLGMSKAFQKMNQPDSSLFYAKFCFKLAKQNNFTSEILEASKFLTDYYNQSKNVDSAFAYQSYIITAKDSLFSQEKNRRLQSLNFDEIIRQQQIEANRVEDIEERNINIQYAVISLSLLTFVIIFFLLTQSIIVNEKWIGFLGVLGLLLVFEFINLIIHPLLAHITHHSPVLMLLASVLIASLLIPLHHKIEHWITNKLVLKNKRLRLAAAKKIIAASEIESKGTDHHP